MAGESPISPSVAGHLLRKFKQPKKKNDESVENPTETDYQLTSRQKEILHLIAHGYRTSEVADKLQISVHTVGNHSRNIYRKLNANSRSEAVFKALNEGIIGL